MEGKAQHHGPLSNQLGSPGESEAKNISFRAEVEYFCRSMTISTTTQHIPSITGIMPSRRWHPMMPCNTHSVFFQSPPRFLTQNLYQISHSHWHLRPRHQVQRWDYDGCRQPWFVTSPPYRALYSKYLSDLKHPMALLRASKACSAYIPSAIIQS